MRTLVVTAANEAYAPLLRGLIGSLQQWRPRPFTDLACLDVGLAPASREWVGQHVAHVIAPAWDLPVDTRLRDEAPHLRALTVRPFLPRYFPGYDIYLWIDADAWVQERFALEWFLAAATGGALAAVPEVDRAYRQSVGAVGWRVRRMHSYFGADAGHRAHWETYFNAGVFALRADAPHWRAWAHSFRTGLEATRGALCCDQSALNHALWTRGLPAHPLPALCNWLCHLARPGFDVGRNRFCEPYAPTRSIGILHLTAHQKDSGVQVRRRGEARPLSLRFAAREHDAAG